MTKGKIFEEKELRELGMRTLDLLLSNIEKDDKKTAASLGTRMYAEFKAMHDLYRDWVTHLMTFIGEHFGDEVLHDAIKETVGSYTRQLGHRYADKDSKQKMRMLAAGLRGHLQPFEIREEEDKFVITARSCGSGGRLIKEGGYEPPRDFLTIRKPQSMTFDRPDFPVYCAHCYFQNISPADESGGPLFVTEPGSRPGVDPCRIYVYKTKSAQ